MGQNAQVKSKMEAAYMLINCVVHGGYTYKVNKVTICEEIKADLPIQSMWKTAVTYLHKHLSHKKCHSLINQLVIPKRIASQIYIKRPKNSIYTASIDKITELYNKLPLKVKFMTIGSFKRYMRKNDIKTV